MRRLLVHDVWTTLREGPRSTPGGKSASRLVAPLAVTAGLLALFLMFRRLSLSGVLNSDDTYLLQEAKAILEGNLLLRGWTLPEDTFQTSLLPIYLAGVALRGVSPALVHIAGALVYALLVPVSCLLARGRATGAQGLLRMLVTFGLLAAPAGLGVVTILEGSFHTATTLLVFAGLLALDRGGSRRRALSLVVFGVLLALAVEGDPLALYVGTLAVSAVCGARLLLAPPAGRGGDAQLLLVALAAGAAGTGLRQLPVLAGGYELTAPVEASLATLDEIPRNVQLAFQGWLQMFGAGFFGSPWGGSSGVPLVRALGYALVAVSLVVAVAPRRRGRAGDRVSQILAAVVAVDAAAVVSGDASVTLAATRYLVPGACAGAILAGRVGVDLLTNKRLRAAAAVLACLYVGLLFVSLQTPPSTQPQAELAAWLARNQLRYGLGSYWAASIVTTASGDQVRVRAVVGAGGRLQPVHHANEAAGYDPNVRGNDARFVVIDPQSDPTVTPNAAAATFGRPAESHRIGRYTVLVWHRNLLWDLGSPSARDGARA